ncbi:hypothetical protein GF318_02280, partial [Candidatus Micrarchaeota archaeon]|nr:hypothetical protein [Candidatus Micrarchaeota archaeon]
EQPVVEIEVPEKPVEVREPVRNLVVVKRTLESGEDRTFHLDLLSQDGELLPGDMIKVREGQWQTAAERFPEIFEARAEKEAPAREKERLYCAKRNGHIDFFSEKDLQTGDEIYVGGAWQKAEDAFDWITEIEIPPEELEAPEEPPTIPEGRKAVTEEGEPPTIPEGFGTGIAPETYQEIYGLEGFQKAELVFPLPNIGTDNELEGMLNRHFPKHTPEGQENRRNSQIRSVARTLVNYVKLQTLGPEFREPFSRFAREKYNRENVDLEVHPLYASAVESLVKDFSQARAIGHAMSLVDEFHTRQKAIGEAGIGPREKTSLVQAAEAKPVSKDALFAKLDVRERAIISVVLGKNTQSTVEDLEHFMEMEPGVRELRTRNFNSSLWTNESVNKEELTAHHKAAMTLLEKCALGDATADEKAQAVLNTAELTSNQLEMVGSFFNLDASRVVSRHIAKFGQWVSDSRRREAAINYWRRGKVDLYTLGSMVHKFRFQGVYDHSEEELQMLREFGKDTGPEAAESFAKAFTEKAVEAKSPMLHPEIVRSFVVFDQVRYSSLNASAQRKEELETLLDFLGVPVERRDVSVNYRNCTLVPRLKKNGQGAYEYGISEDAISTITIKSSERESIVLDAVFDGMGGHKDGSRAALIAKDVLETAALAGWIQTPEDVRRALVIGDLAIMTEQLRDKGENINGYRPASSMGTTAVVAFQQGGKFYAINCGDSECRIIREGKAIFKSRSHSLAYDLQRDGADMNSEAVQIYLRGREFVIVSCLGVSPKYININNEEKGDYVPIELKSGDVIAVDSDGVNEPVCGDHEYPLFIMEANGDLEQARANIAQLARTRISNKKSYPTRCPCQQKTGKNDDRSLILRYAEGGMAPFQESDTIKKN